mmetsp:Transcript_44599/g.93326  ORF Transcript_44599/g.93326 Transcript_44599/m.93326 type:complete len:89 (-) Transcript_44599:4086-4352(-)
MDTSRQKQKCFFFAEGVPFLASHAISFTKIAKKAFSNIQSLVLSLIMFCKEPDDQLGVESMLKLCLADQTETRCDCIKLGIPSSCHPT